MELVPFLLPGLWLLVLGFVLDRLLRRFFDAVPARVWGLFAALLLVLFTDVLFGGQTLLPVGEIDRFPPFRQLGLETVEENPLQRDLTHAIAPWQAEVRRAYSRGEWPLWNSSSGAGVPLLANPQAMSLHPLVLAAFPVSLPGALGLICALRILVSLVFTFLLLRRQGLSEAPALLASLAYGLGGFMILWLGWPHTNSTAMLPVVLYATVLWSERGERSDLVLLTLGLFSTFVTGHPETALYVLTLGGLFALARIRAAEGRRWKVFRGWALAAVLGGLLAAPVLLPAASYLSKTNRYETMVQRNERLTGEGLLTDRWAGNLLTAPERLAPNVAPNAWGNNRWGEYWGHHNINEAAGGFVGTATCLAALLAFLPATRRRFPQERFMLGVAAFCVVVLLRPPFLIELMVRLPPFDKSPTYHGRLTMVLGFALAYLAACTLERWRRDELSRRHVAGATAAVGGLVLWAYLAHPHPDDPTLLAGLRHTSLAIQLSVLGLAAACLLRARRAARHRLAWAFVGLVAVELLIFHGEVNTPAPRSHFYPASPPLTHIQDRLADDAEGYRMFGLYASLPPEFAAVYDLPDLRGLGPSQAVRLSRLLDPVRQRRGSFLFSQPDHPVLDLLGVRYVLAEPHHSPPDSVEEVFRDVHGVVWRRPGAMSRLFLPRSTALLSPGTTSWTKWTAENPSFAETSLVLPSPRRQSPWTATRPEASGLEMVGVADTHVEARVDLAEERLMASGIYQDRGWHLLVDGERRPTIRANGPLVAAWLPAGEHRIDLVYRPPGFFAGMLLAAFAAGILWIISVPPPGPRRQRPGPAR